MSDVIEVSMTETDHAHGKEIMGQVCDQHGSDKNFPDQVPQPDRETLNRWLYCVLATGESGDDATRGEMSAAGLTTRRHQQHEIIRRSLIATIVIEADRSTCPSSQCRHVDGTRFEGVSGSRTRYSTKDSAQTQNLLRAINSVALRA